MRWKRNLSSILKDSAVEAAILARIRYHDSSPNSWVVLDAFQRFFSIKNKDSISNFFHFKDGSCLKIDQEGIFWEPKVSKDLDHLEDCAYSTWYIAQRIGNIRWATTFLGPFPYED